MEAVMDTDRDSDRHRFIGIDVGGTGIKWSLIEGRRTLRTGHAATPRTGGEAVLATIEELALSIDPNAIGIGLAFPGTIDAVNRRTVFVPNIPGDWNGNPVADYIEARCGIPVALLNDARAFANGELFAGAALGESDALFITLGTGVGGAIALGGKILVGDMDAIGEIGHALVDLDGELCSCGGRGCLETFASAPAVIGYVTRAALTSQAVMVEQLSVGRGEPITGHVVAQAADAGDRWALDAFSRAGRHIGVAAASICLLLRIRTVVIGGGLAGALHHITPSVTSVLAQRTSMTGHVAVRKAELGPGAGSIGAAFYAATVVGAAALDGPVTS